MKSERPEQTRRGWTALLSGLVLLAGVYIGGYFVLCDVGRFTMDSDRRYVVRTFPTPLIANAYQSVARVESKLTGKVVWAMWPDWPFEPGTRSASSLKKSTQR